MVKKQNYDIYTEYYLNQAGSGFSNVYSAPIYQKGYGIGSFLGGLFRTVLPILKKGATVLGSECLNSGKNIISDIVSNQDPEIVIKKRGKEAIHNLSRVVADKMFGEGYKSMSAKKRKQSDSKSQPVKKRKKTQSKIQVKKTSKKSPTKKKKPIRTKSEIFDIFS